jgi:hypothetical protein
MASPPAHPDGEVLRRGPIPPIPGPLPHRLKGAFHPFSRRPSLLHCAPHFWPSTCPSSSPRIEPRNPVFPQLELGLAFCLARSFWPWAFSQFIALPPHASQGPTGKPRRGGTSRVWLGVWGSGARPPSLLTITSNSFRSTPPYRTYRAVPVDGWPPSSPSVFIATAARQWQEEIIAALANRQVPVVISLSRCETNFLSSIARGVTEHPWPPRSPRPLAGFLQQIDAIIRSGRSVGRGS